MKIDLILLEMSLPFFFPLFQYLTCTLARVFAYGFPETLPHLLARQGRGFSFSAIIEEKENNLAQFEFSRI